MNTLPFDLPELEQLIDAVRDERITAAQVARLEEILREHARARRYYGRAMRLHGYLEQNAAAVSAAEQAPEELQSPPVRPAQVPAGSARRRRWAPWVGAAGALAACLLLAAWLFGPALWKGPDRHAERPDKQIDAPGPRVVALSPGWKIEPTGSADRPDQAEYSVVDEAVVRLDRGELRVASVGDGQAPTLIVRTPAGDVSARDTRFTVGYHPLPAPPMRGTSPVNSLVRVFVLSGAVTLTNDRGSVTGDGNELLVASEQSAPVKQVVRANSDFAIDLYRQLAKENDGKNVLVSPYSVSIALAMAAEGARGKTAEEMGQVLRWPTAMQRLGDDAQRIPWESSAVHNGLASLSRMLNQQQDTPEKQAIRRQIVSLEQELRALKERNARLRQQDFQAYRRGRDEEEQLVGRLNGLIGQVDQYELSIANALWGEQTYPFDPDFVKTVTGAYDTNAVRTADFKRDFQRQRVLINEWVDSQTRQRIKDLLPERSLSAATRMVLASALYFKGDWKSPFDKSETEEQDFTLADGGTANILLMQRRSIKSARYGAFRADGALFDSPRWIRRGQTEADRYPDENGFAMVELPYRGDDLAMVVIAPNRADGLDEIEQRLSGETLNRWIEQLHQRKVHVLLPKFKAQTSYDLVGNLRAMGMGSALDAARADFSGMTLSGSKDLCISGVFHKAFIDVHEAGSEATVATSGRDTDPAPPFTPTLRADRPFMYLIRDRRSGSILLLGRMAQP